LQAIELPIKAFNNGWYEYNYIRHLNLREKNWKSYLKAILTPNSTMSFMKRLNLRFISEFAGEKIRLVK